MLDNESVAVEGATGAPSTASTKRTERLAEPVSVTEAAAPVGCSASTSGSKRGSRTSMRYTPLGTPRAANLPSRTCARVATSSPLASRIEVRINAENPFQGFLPSTGTISNLRTPGGPWTRLDSAMYRGMEVGLAYDPMLAKLIVWGPDRAQAIARMIRAIQETNVGGVHTSLPAALQVLQHADFQAGRFDTHFLEGLTIQSPEKWADLVAVAATIHRHRLAKRRALSPVDSARDGWRTRTRAEVTGHVQRAGSQEVSQ